MGNYIDQLVDLYAKYDVDIVNKDESLLKDAFGLLPSELANNKEFTLAQLLVAELKSRVEQRNANFETPDQQARMAEGLMLLLDMAMYDIHKDSTKRQKMDVLEKLILKMFSEQWEENIQDHFKFIASLLKEWKTYFLSYTNRDSADINKKYQAVIERFVNPEILEKRNRQEDSLLADAIVKLLKKENILGYFYDKENIKLGDVLKKRIKSAAAGTFVFVQIIQQESFVFEEPNWCFEEFNIFEYYNNEIITWNQSYEDIFCQRYSALLAEDTVPVGLPMVYEAWRNRVYTEQHYEKLPTDPDEFKDAIRNIADGILNLQKQIIDSVPPLAGNVGNAEPESISIR